MKVIKTPDEIEAIYDKARIGETKGTRFPEMTYEEGIVAFIDWLTGRREENPFD